MEWIVEGLNALVKFTQRTHVTSLAVPALGCGLGGLQWPSVFDAMSAAFQDVPTETRVSIYPPQNKRNFRPWPE